MPLCFFFFLGRNGGPKAHLSSNQYLQFLSLAQLNNEPEFYKLIIGWYPLYFIIFILVKPSIWVRFKIYILFAYIFPISLFTVLRFYLYLFYSGSLLISLICLRSFFPAIVGHSPSHICWICIFVTLLFLYYFAYDYYVFKVNNLVGTRKMPL